MTTTPGKQHQAPEQQTPARPIATSAEQPVRAVSRRSFLHLAAGAAAATALAGCWGTSPAGKAGGSQKAAEKIQLVYQDWSTNWFPPMVQEALAEFHDSHPNIRVFYVPDPENTRYEEKVLADMQAGTMADVFEGCCTQFPTWAQSDYLLDLRPYVKADVDQATIADWDPAQYRALFTQDGRQFGLPKYHGALALYYNKDMLRAAGIDFPNENWNHNDYLEAMRRLTRPNQRWGSMLQVLWERLQVHVNAWGGNFVDPADPHRSHMAEPATLAALQWLRDRMWVDHAMPQPGEVNNMGTREAFVAGKVAMVEDGSWALKDVLTQAAFDVGVAPLPAGPVRRATLASTDGFGIYAHSRHPDAAWELMKFLISKEYGRQMARTALLQPARASLLDEWARFVREEFPAKTRDLDIAAFAHGHVHGYSVTTEVFANMADAKQIVAAAWDRIFTFGEAPVESMVEISRQVEALQRTGSLPANLPVAQAPRGGAARVNTGASK